MDEIGGYRLVALLGEGGMGRVHLARAASGRLVAVKTVREHLAADARFRERFRRETAAARSVAGPFTAAVLAADPEAVRPWLATEFCTGPTLTGAVSVLGPLASGDLAALGAALAEAVAAVHAVGLVHRDLKPSNIVVTRDGPMVIDFGIARTAADESLTGSGEVVGSPGFIAPELLTGTGEPGPAVDVFALGALLAYAATGRPPFGTGPVHQVLYRTMNSPPDLDGVAETAGGDGAAGWRELLGSCLSREPGERPTVAELLDACAARTEGDPWWEREAVSGLIRRREEEVAALVARAREWESVAGAEAGNRAGVGTAADVGAGADVGTTAAEDTPTDTPAAGPRTRGTTPRGPASGTTLAPGRAGAAPVVGGSPGASRRTFLRWGGAALAAGSAIGAVAWFTELTGDDDKDGADSGPSASPGPYTLGRALWTRDIGDALPIRHGDALYLVSESALTRLDARTGAVGWSYPAEDIAHVVPGDGVVHLARSSSMSLAVIVALDAATGVAKWSANPAVRNPHRPPGPRESDPSDPGLVASVDGEHSRLSVSADILCVVTYSSYATLWAERVARKRPWRAYGYDPRTGAPLWFHEGAPAGVAGLDQRDGRIGVAAASPYSAEEKETDAALTVLRARDGTLDREISAGARYPESYLGVRGIRYYARAGRLKAVDLATRRTRWSLEQAEENRDAAITDTAAAGLVHTADHRSLKALDADTGRTRWSLTEVGLLEDGSLAVADGLVYGTGTSPEGGEAIGDTPGWGVHARNAATGALVWAAETGEVRTVIARSGPEGETDEKDEKSSEGADGAETGADETGLVHVVSASGTLSTFAAPELT
ncbi:protein kinase [Streptomyces sp. NPDC058653]|uniref:protein kinase domain-containing protein n=1 Tax=Streptomyces sp. NPDC058653 TaxID=3346576 RepID=UPI003655A91C